MHEDELMVDGIAEEYEALLPDGWGEGDDFFADPSTWSGNAKQTDESAEQQGDDGSTETDTGVEEAPTTGDTEDPDNRSAESDTAQTESGQTEEPVKNSRILKLKVNHTEQEIDINALSDEELIARLQKSAAFDAMKDDQMKAKYREIYNEQIDAGMTEAAARMVAANECGGKAYPLEDPAPETVEEQPQATAASPRDTIAELAQLKALYPDFSEVPDEVARAYANGANLLTAYVAYREQQTSKTAASLKKENQVLKQNAASAAKAPVKGVTGGGATDTKPKNDLLAGFDSYGDW